MSDPRLDALAETARNRGLRLVRSRIRTPGKQGFGTAGLTDASGKPVFGMNGKAPTATPDAIEDYLRNLEAQDWGASIDVPLERRRATTNDSAATKGTSGRLRSAPASSTQSRTRPPSKPRLAPKPKPSPIPQIREARTSDAERLAELINELGHAIDAKQVRRNLTALLRSAEAPLVATLDGEVVGLCSIGKRVVINRPAPLGRISTLIVTRSAQGRGIGRMLVEAAETWMRKNGCALVEVTSNDRLAAAHAFYRHLGYERTSIRFAKSL